MPGEIAAQIIPFPRRPAAHSDLLRLERALASLTAALAEQRSAMRAWQDSLEALRESAQCLDGGVAEYRHSLELAGAALSGLSVQAHALEALADGVSAP